MCNHVLTVSFITKLYFCKINIDNGFSLTKFFLIRVTELFMTLFLLSGKASSLVHYMACKVGLQLFKFTWKCLF